MSITKVGSDGSSRGLLEHFTLDSGQMTLPSTAIKVISSGLSKRHERFIQYEWVEFHFGIAVSIKPAASVLYYHAVLLDFIMKVICKTSKKC